MKHYSKLIKDEYLGISGIISSINHFKKKNESIEELIFIIQKACKSIEEWVIEFRLDNLKSNFVYGITIQDISLMNFENKIELLQRYCNIYVLLLHISKSTQTNLDSNYKEKINSKKLKKEGDKKVEQYVKKANKRCKKNFKRYLL